MGVERAEHFIRVKRSTKEALFRLRRMGDSYDAVIRRLLAERGSGAREADVPEEVYEFLREVAEACSQGGGIADVGDAFSRFIAKLGVFLGYRGEDFTDWGFREAVKAKIVTFLGIDDPLVLKTTVLTRILDSLIEEEGIQELRPLRDELLYILTQASLRRRRSHEA